jgi:hypothetical protein
VGGEEGDHREYLDDERGGEDSLSTEEVRQTACGEQGQQQRACVGSEDESQRE